MRQPWRASDGRDPDADGAADPSPAAARLPSLFPRPRPRPDMMAAPQGTTRVLPHHPVALQLHTPGWRGKYRFPACQAVRAAVSAILPIILLSPSHVLNSEGSPVAETRSKKNGASAQRTKARSLNLSVENRAGAITAGSPIACASRAGAQLRVPRPQLRHAGRLTLPRVVARVGTACGSRGTGGGELSPSGGRAAAALSPVHAAKAADVAARPKLGLRAPVRPSPPPVEVPAGFGGDCGGH